VFGLEKFDQRNPIRTSAIQSCFIYKSTVIKVIIRGESHLSLVKIQTTENTSHKSSKPQSNLYCKLCIELLSARSHEASI